MTEQQLQLKHLETSAEYNEFAKLLISHNFDNALLQRSFGSSPVPNWMTHSTDSFELSQYWIYQFFDNCEPAIKEMWLKNGLFQKDNSWFEDIWIKWTNRISNVYFLAGNINDYAFSYRKGYMPIAHYLTEEFLNRPNGCQSVVKYRLSQPFEVEPSESTGFDETVSKLRSQIEHHKNLERLPTWEQLIIDFNFIDEILNEKRDIVILIENADAIFTSDNANITQNLLSDYLVRWAFSTEVAGNNNAIILTAESSEGISKHLISQSNKVEIINVPRPKKEKERLKFILYLHAISKLNLTPNIRSKTFKIPSFGRALLTNRVSISQQLGNLAFHTSGLNYTGIEDLILQINAKGDSTFGVINQVKGNILQTESGGLLELVNSKKSLINDIDGYDEIKQQLLVISRIINDPDASKLRKRTVPMGILFVGPPGTGKTVVAEAFSKECGMNFLKLGDFRSKWVGESERNLSKILELIKSYSPVIVFMDELDQTEGGRGTGGNNDVDKRLFSKLLQFMSDTKNRGKVLWIAASNRPDIIDAALKRPGRFDLKIPFLPQEKDDRRKSFGRYLKNNEYPELKTEISSNEWEDILTNSYRFTGAEIEEIVNSTIRKKIMNASSNQTDIVIEGAAILNTIENFQPGIKTKAFNDMIEASLADVTSRELIPNDWRNWKNDFKKKNE